MVVRSLRSRCRKVSVPFEAGYRASMRLMAFEPFSSDRAAM